MVDFFPAEEERERQSIYRAARSVKRRDKSIYNALRSIYEDSTFVGEIRELWPEIPLVANLRCGLWYWRRFDATCYFKSTDGHTNNLSFNTSRLNLHLPLLAGQKGGCIIVDSTRKGKRFPDSMSKTIPIWACVLNRYMFNHFKKYRNEQYVQEGSTSSEQNGDNLLARWDCSLHLPLWVPETEKAAIEGRLEEWTRQLDESGADITSIVSCLRKPLRPLWISQKTLIWLNEVPEHDSWDFTPIILLSASASSGELQCRKSSELSWSYIPGAGDDEESWAKGLSPKLFWTHVNDLIDSGPDLCNQKVAEIIENDRVYRARRGQEAPQVSSRVDSVTAGAEMTFSENSNPELLMKNPDEECLIFWLGSTNLAIGPSHNAAYNVTGFDYVLNCDQNPIVEAHPEAYLHLSMTGSKFDRFSISRNLPPAVNFAKTGLSQGKKLLVCCHNGEDISVCVCLAILTSLFNEKGVFDGGSCFRRRSVTKLDMRRRLIFICRYAVNARPSRGNLRQVFGFLSSRNEDSDD